MCVPWAYSLSPHITAPFCCLKKTVKWLKWQQLLMRRDSPEYAAKAPSPLCLGHLLSKCDDLVAKLILWNSDMEFTKKPCMQTLTLFAWLWKSRVCLGQVPWDFLRLSPQGRTMSQEGGAAGAASPPGGSSLTSHLDDSGHTQSHSDQRDWLPLPSDG